jgi:arabinose-5-phosphate isomerase
MDKQTMLTEAQNLIRAEGQVLMDTAEHLDASFIAAVELVANCEGKILLTGAGTSGMIARRNAHLLAVCGMPAFFVHPSDALHGEAALITNGDVLIALSKAGKSAEINQFVTVAKQRGAQIIAWTANPDSELAQLSDVVIVLHTDPKGEGEGILPFGSTLANGAVGDALCLMAKRLRGFDLAEMKQTHPAGGTAELIEQTRQQADGDA